MRVEEEIADAILLDDKFRVKGVIDREKVNPAAYYSEDAAAGIYKLEYLKQLIETAERIDGGSEYWIIVGDEEPLTLIPRDSETELAYMLGGRVKGGRTHITNPLEETESNESESE